MPKRDTTTLIVGGAALAGIAYYLYKKSQPQAAATTQPANVQKPTVTANTPIVGSITQGVITEHPYLAPGLKGFDGVDENLGLAGFFDGVTIPPWMLVLGAGFLYYQFIYLKQAKKG